MGLNEKFFASALESYDGVNNYDACNTDSYPGFGTTWFNLTDVGNDGTLNGATWDSDCYFDFDGSNDFIDFGDMAGISPELSIAMWVNPDSTQVQHATLIDFEHSNDEGWVISQNSTTTNQYKFALYDGSSYDISPNFSLTAGNWTHLCFVINSVNNFKYYINGTRVGLGFNGWNGLGSQVRRLNLGCWGSTTGTNRSRFWNGQISKFGLYDEALTQSEITALHAEGR